MFYFHTIGIKSASAQRLPGHPCQSYVPIYSLTNQRPYALAGGNFKLHVNIAGFYCKQQNCAAEIATDVQLGMSATLLHQLSGR